MPRAHLLYSTYRVRRTQQCQHLRRPRRCTPRPGNCAARKRRDVPICFVVRLLLRLGGRLCSASLRPTVTGRDSGWRVDDAIPFASVATCSVQSSVVSGLWQKQKAGSASKLISCGWRTLQRCSPMQRNLGTAQPRPRPQVIQQTRI